MTNLCKNASIVFTVTVLLAANTLAQDTSSTNLTKEETQLQLRALSDETIQLAIEKELLASPAVDADKIDVKVEDAVVTLSGRVKHLLAEEIAVAMAQRIRGVVSVVDLMEVETDRRADAEIRRDVEAAIASDAATHKLKPAIAVKEGVVTLSGNVAVLGEKLLLEQVAKRVIGVTEVQNQLVSEHRKDVSDEELKAEIAELYQYNVLLDNAELDVAVRDGVVVLNGVVSTAYQRSQASLLAYRAGAKTVDTRGIRISDRHSNRMLREKRYETPFFGRGNTIRD